MLILAIIVFCLTAILGLYLISYVYQHKETPKGIVFTHGPMGAMGIVILIICAIFYSPTLWISVILFALAALVGFMMVFRDITGKHVPKWLASLHGLIAICGFAYLLWYAYLNW